MKYPINFIFLLMLCGIKVALAADFPLTAIYTETVNLIPNISNDNGNLFYTLKDNSSNKIISKGHLTNGTKVLIYSKGFDYPVTAAKRTTLDENEREFELTISGIKIKNQQ